MLINPKTYTVTRFTGGAYVDGEWVQGTPSTFTTKLDVQPEDDGKRSDAFPSGWQTRHVLKAYQDDIANKLHTVNQEGPEKADRVDIDGVLFEVHEREDWAQWSASPLAHYRYVLVELDDAGNGGP